MMPEMQAVRPFIGAKDYELSRRFYSHLGFSETVLAPNLSLFQAPAFAFYLQDAYVRDWVDNTMLFVEVPDIEAFWQWLSSLQLAHHFYGVKVVPIRNEAWGRVCFLHDPAGILWQFGQFHKQSM